MTLSLQDESFWFVPVYPTPEQMQALYDIEGPKKIAAEPAKKD